VNHLIDLDELARRVEELAADWRKVGTVSAFTWRDERGTWPKPIVSVRADVFARESLGFRVETRAGELEIVTWVGGWFDAGWIKDGEYGTPFGEFIDLDGALSFIVKTVEDFLH
jgi:hypothetical protein